MSGPTYDRIGRGYAGSRRTDPRIAARIEQALGDARTVLNVGAGAGSYEPEDREVTAVEPSAEMIAQRPAGSAVVVQANAEELPFEDGSFDAAMAIISDHHWSDRAAGLREMARVARRRVLVLNTDPNLAKLFWLTQDYLPGFLRLIPERYRQQGYWEQELQELLGNVENLPVPVPHDCRDGFYQAHWRRPDAYLDPRVRDAISVFHALPAQEVAAAMERLEDDLESGAWEQRHGSLRELQELDLGLRLVVSDATASPREIVNRSTGERIVFLRTAEETDGELLEMDNFWARADHQTPMHIHPEMEERWEVIAGRVRFEVGEIAQTAAPGATVVAAPGTPPSARSVGSEPAHLRIQMRPALRWQEFVERLFALASPTPGASGSDSVAGLMREFSSEIAPAPPR